MGDEGQACPEGGVMRGASPDLNCIRVLKEIESIIVNVLSNEDYFDKMGYLNSDGRKLLYRISYYLGDLCSEGGPVRRYYRRALRDPNIDNLLKLREAVASIAERLMGRRIG
jgi:hypothetical protein